MTNKNEDSPAAKSEITRDAYGRAILPLDVELRMWALNMSVNAEEKYRGLTEEHSQIQDRILSNAKLFEDYIKGPSVAND